MINVQESDRSNRIFGQRVLSILQVEGILKDSDQHLVPCQAALAVEQEITKTRVACFRDLSDLSANNRLACVSPRACCLCSVFVLDSRHSVRW